MVTSKEKKFNVCMILFACISTFAGILTMAIGGIRDGVESITFGIGVIVFLIGLLFAGIALFLCCHWCDSDN
jgi:hypothetical protein